MTQHDDQLADIQTRMVRKVREVAGVHEKDAMIIAKEMIRVFLSNFVGEQIYIPYKDPDLKFKVLADFTGANRDQVCARYGISKRTFYRMLRSSRPQK